MKQTRLVNTRDNQSGQGLKDLISDLPDNIVMAEIGCYKGDSTLIFLDSGKVKEFYAVDTWQPGRFDNAFIEFKKVTEGRGVKILQMNMLTAWKRLPMLDFAYIDGDHSYEWVKRDITYCLKVLKPGGIISGHDYSEQYNDRVVRAVDEILGKPDEVYIDTSWMKRL